MDFTKNQVKAAVIQCLDKYFSLIKNKYNIPYNDHEIILKESFKSIDVYLDFLENIRNE